MICVLRVTTMNSLQTKEDYQELLTEARKVDELWRIKTDDLGYFTCQKD